MKCIVSSIFHTLLGPNSRRLRVEYLRYDVRRSYPTVRRSTISSSISSQELTDFCVDVSPPLLTHWQNCVRIHVSLVSAATRSLAIVGDLFVLLATWVKTYKLSEEARKANIRTSISQLLIRDGPSFIFHSYMPAFIHNRFTRINILRVRLISSDPASKNSAMLKLMVSY